jgi:predicted amidophosphoribosyltransferase
VVVAGTYRGSLRRLVGDAKAGGRPAAVAALADWGGRLLAPQLPPGLAVLAVPPNRGRRSGPHLATALAQALARQLGGPCLARLATTRPAAVQHELPMDERRRAVAGLFRVRGGPPLPSELVLVDDLLTSGATLTAAAAVLRRAGVQRILGAVLGRTPDPGIAVRNDA